jgi:FixJ family two-component response regulator
MTTDRLIAIVDDDAALRDSLANLMRSAGFRTHGFSSAEAFLGSPLARETACLILDVRMAGMNGLELQRRLAAPGWHFPSSSSPPMGTATLAREPSKRGPRASWTNPATAPSCSKRSRRRCAFI